MAAAIPAPARDAAQESDLSQSFWQQTAALGALDEQQRLALPSVVVPQACNLLLNPLHPAMAQVLLVQQEPFQLDQRLG